MSMMAVRTLSALTKMVRCIENGIMVSLDFTNPVKSNDIIGWKSDRGWLYLTLLGVRAPKNQIPSATFNGVVKDIVLDDFDDFYVIALSRKDNICISVGVWISYGRIHRLEKISMNISDETDA